MAMELPSSEKMREAGVCWPGRRERREKTRSGLGVRQGGKTMRDRAARGFLFKFYFAR